MLFSLIIPCYNSIKYLPNLFKKLVIATKTFNNIEIIFVNDGSNDKTLQYLQQNQIRLHNVIILDQTNKGVSVARNYGIEHATGEWLLFLDADDWFSDNYFIHLENAISTNPQIGIYYTDIKKYYEKTKSSIEFDLSMPTTGYIDQNGFAINDNISLEKIKDNDLNFFDLRKINQIFRTACRVVFNNKIIKKHNLKFDIDLKVFEDTVFHYDYLIALEKSWHNYINHQVIADQIQDTVTSNNINCLSTPYCYRAGFLNNDTYYYFQERKRDLRTHDPSYKNLLFSYVRFLEEMCDDISHSKALSNNIIYEIYSILTWGILASLLQSSSINTFNKQDRTNLVKFFVLLQQIFTTINSLNGSELLFDKIINNSILSDSYGIYLSLLFQKAIKDPQTLNHVLVYFTQNQQELELIKASTKKINLHNHKSISSNNELANLEHKTKFIYPNHKTEPYLYVYLRNYCGKKYLSILTSEPQNATIIINKVQSNNQSLLSGSNITFVDTEVFGVEIGQNIEVCIDKLNQQEIYELLKEFEPLYNQTRVKFNQSYKEYIRLEIKCLFDENLYGIHIINKNALFNISDKIVNNIGKYLEQANLDYSHLYYGIDYFNEINHNDSANKNDAIIQLVHLDDFKSQILQNQQLKFNSLTSLSHHKKVDKDTSNYIHGKFITISQYKNKKKLGSHITLPFKHQYIKKHLDVLTNASNLLIRASVLNNRKYICEHFNANMLNSKNLFIIIDEYINPYLLANYSYLPNCKLVFKNKAYYEEFLYNLLQDDLISDNLKKNQLAYKDIWKLLARSIIVQ